MSLKIDTFVLGPFQTNCYVLQDSGQTWVVDPGLDARELVDFLVAEKLSPSRILITHGHGDHIAGIPEVRQAFPNAKICCTAGDAPMLQSPQLNLSYMFGLMLVIPPADELLEPLQELSLGNTVWEVLDTSGHTIGAVSYLCRSEGVVLTGDALFAGSVGRTDMPGGNSARQLKNIREKLMTLPDFTRVLSGHGDETSIGQERMNNRFLSGAY